LAPAVSAEAASGVTVPGPAATAEFGGLARVDVGPDGTVFVLDYGRKQIDSISPDGMVDIVTTTKLVDLQDVAVSPDGEVFVSGSRRIMKVNDDGTVSVVVEGGGGRLAFAPDGTLYFSVVCGVDALTTAGSIEVVVAPPASDPLCEDSPRFVAADLAVAPDGLLYVAKASTSNSERGSVVSVSATGTVETVAGDWGSLGAPSRVAVTPSGQIFLANPGLHELLPGRGLRDVAAGVTDVAVNDLSDISAGSDGSIYATTMYHQQVLRFAPNGSVEVIAGNGAIANESAPLVSSRPPRPLMPAVGTPVTGQVSVGQTLYATSGVWMTPGPVTMAFTWLVDGRPAGEGDTFVVPSSAAGRSISFRATASSDGFNPGWADSNVVRVASRTAVAVRPLQLLSAPQVRGKAIVGRTVRSSSGRWSSPVHVTYQWFIGKRAVPHATAPTLRLRKSFAGKRVSVRVTATATGSNQRVAARAAARLVKR
jgi:hypothetical protein